MKKYDGPPIPQITKQTTPKEAKGIKNALKLVRHAEEGMESETLPMYRGRLDKKQLAIEVGFGRSAYQQNRHIANVVAWIEKELGQLPSGASARGGSTEAERLLKSEVERLKIRNIVLKTDLDDARARLKELGYEEEAVESGEARLPW